MRPTPTRATPMPAEGSWRHAIAGGLVAGTLDMIYICSFWALRGVPPIRIFQSVAAGWLGREDAIAGGAGTALLGLGSHYLIAICMAAAFLVAARRFPVLVLAPWLSGMLYGIVLYAVMTFIVVPLSAAGTGALPALRASDLSHLAAHMLLVGIPCAWFARRALRGQSA